MGYCEEHDSVYAGGECPVCAGDEPASPSGSGRDPRPDPGQDGRTGPDQGRAGSHDDDRPADQPADIGDAVRDRVDDALDGDVNVETDSGDVVVGSQSKSVERDDHVEVDESETVVDESETVVDERTVVSDSVVNRSNVGGEGTDDERSSGTRPGDERGSGSGSGSGSRPGSERRRAGESSQDRTRTCPHCESEVGSDDAFCTSCGTELGDSESRG